MPFQNFDSIFLAVALLVPGFIIHSIECLVLTRRRLDPAKDWLRLLVLSLLNYSLCYSLASLFLSPLQIQQDGLTSPVTWIGVIFVSPIILGTLLAFNASREWSQRLLHKMHIRTIHAIPSAWNWLSGGWNTLNTGYSLPSGIKAVSQAFLEENHLLRLILMNATYTLNNYVI